jgi:nucleotide-binding universal stress UspA family protein
MTKDIGLVPLDGSATAESVLPMALASARALDLDLVLVQLVREAWPGGDAKAEAALGPARHYLDGVAASLADAGITVSTRALPGGDDIAAAISGAAEAENAALIMLATHGRTGLRRIMMGSVADAVVRSATRPVLVVRARPGSQTGVAGLSRILAPLDGSPLAEGAIDIAARVARRAGATLDLVRVAPWTASLVAGMPDIPIPEGLDEDLEKGAYEYLREVERTLPRDVSHERHVLRGDAALGILDHADATGADLIVMSTRGRSPATRWALGSVADRVLREGDRPVLLVRAGAATP